MSWRFHLVAQHDLLILRSGLVLTEHQELIFPELAANQPDQTSRQDHEGKGNLEKKNCYEPKYSEGPHDFILESFRTDADYGLGDNGHDRSFHCKTCRRIPSDLSIYRR